MKKYILIGVVLISGFLYSCSKDDDQDLNNYQLDAQEYGTGGDDDQIKPPPPPIILP